MASAVEIVTVREAPTVREVLPRLNVVNMLVTLIGCCHGIRLRGVAKTLAGVLLWKVDMQSVMIEVISGVRHRCEHVEVR